MLPWDRAAEHAICTQQHGVAYSTQGAVTVLDAICGDDMVAPLQGMGGGRGEGERGQGYRKLWQQVITCGTSRK